MHGDSAIIGDALEHRESIYGDHIGIAKLSSRDDTEYGKVLYALEMLLKRVAEDKVAPVEQSM